LLAGRQVAETLSGQDSLTLHYDAYGVTIDDVPYRVYDTTGFDDYRTNPSGFLYAITNAHKLAKELREKGGVYLLLYCIKGDIMPSTWIANYRLLYEFLFEKVPVALIATHLEREDHMDDWYARNKELFESQAVKYVDHACITAADNPDPKCRGKYEMSRTEVGKLISRQAQHWNRGDWSHARVVEEVDNPSTRKASKADILVFLTKRCGSVFFSVLTSDDRCKTIVLFGETGVGKSSLINLMADKEIANTSPDMQQCTFLWKEYTIGFDGDLYTVFETIGLDEPQLGIKEYLESMEYAYRLIRELDERGGIDLLLFCVRARFPGITATTQSNYRLFNTFLCEKKVPIVLAITNLEREKRMEDWWERNHGTFDKYQIQAAGHACITAANRLDSRHKQLYEESRITIRNLVKEFTADELKRTWRGWDGLFVSFMRRLKELLSVGSHVRRKDLVPHLTKRCGISSGTAKQLANMIKKDVG
ncbi:P-loop containing nucleoside triphosphate hydrolase protein, partial [Suillus cothurnatus]